MYGVLVLGRQKQPCLDDLTMVVYIIINLKGKEGPAGAAQRCHLLGVKTNADLFSSASA